MNKAKLKQILLITDGCSNTGISPVEAARSAGKYGITINVIGVGNPDIPCKAEEEIKQIAEVGNGLYEIVTPRQLSKTMQMVTRQAMTKTIHQVVHYELEQLLGTSSLSDVPPQTRMKVVDKAEEIGEICTLKVLLLIDTSASMRSKIKAVEQAVYDFELSLHSRAGDNLIAVATFPGKLTNLDIKLEWTENISGLSFIPEQLSISGITPTGPALHESLQLFGGSDDGDNSKNYDFPERDEKKKQISNSGLLSDYVY